jgi:serine/threonine protein kinase
MDHPNIARVFDAGATDQGRPFFVMELVKGVPITRYCDDHHLTLRQRLELFVPVCQAVQHAHQKGIVHRDLKPSNVLVATYDGRPVVKVIDFGVAKAAGQPLTEKTLVTGLGAVVGTLEYMSPEQAELNNLDVDTRSDVYSLGALLYELLTGTTPLQKNRVHAAALLEVLRLVREEEPQRPSTRLSTTEGLPGIAANRGLEPRKLTGLVRGELDWIALKALEKDRSRRYETANGFAMDVQRYLADETVQACPPSAGYRLRKLVRRNKGPVLVAGVVLLSLVAGIVGTTWGLVRAEAARTAAQQRLGQVEKGNLLLTSIFADLDPREEETDDRPLRVLLAERLVRAADQLEDDAVGDPLAVARLQSRLGLSLRRLGMADQAIPLLVKARQAQAARLSPDHPDLLETMCELGNSYYAVGRFTDSIELDEETLALCRAGLGPDHPDTLRNMSNLANSYYAVGRFADALRLREETLPLRRTRLGPDHPDTLASMSNLAVSYHALRRHPEALRLREEALAITKAKFGPTHPNTLYSMYTLAGSYEALGRYPEALQMNEETLAFRRVKLGPDHPRTLASMHQLGYSYSLAGRHADALKLTEETLALRRVKLGPDHPDTLKSMGGLAAAYAALGRHADALKLNEETLALRKGKLGPDHPDTLVSMSNLANSYYAVGRHADALKFHQEALALRMGKLGPDDPDSLKNAAGVAAALVKLDRGAEALPLIDDCLRRANSAQTNPRLIARFMYIRLEHYQKMKDAVGCRVTAEMWERRKYSDPVSLYDAGSMRAVTAAALGATAKSDAGAAVAAAEADRAMTWLRRAVAAGYDNSVQFGKDTDLNGLRDREDFKALVAELKARPPEPKK